MAKSPSARVGVFKMGLRAGERTHASIDRLIVHCSGTSNGDGRWTIKDVDDWHALRGWRRRAWARDICRPNLIAVGYHFVVEANGFWRAGRAVPEIGAHARPENTPSIGVCLMGENKFSLAQWESLVRIIDACKTLCPNITTIKGHRDVVGVRKKCPGFDVAEWLARDMKPIEKNVLR